MSTTCHATCVAAGTQSAFPSDSRQDGGKHSERAEQANDKSSEGVEVDIAGIFDEAESKRHASALTYFKAASQQPSMDFDFGHLKSTLVFLRLLAADASEIGALLRENSSSCKDDGAHIVLSRRKGTRAVYLMHIKRPCIIQVADCKKVALGFRPCTSLLAFRLASALSS